jgi:hypothetical protein
MLARPAPLHFPKMKGKSKTCWPSPARVQSRGSRHDEARILSSVRAETGLWGADDLSSPASLCGRKAIFHRISDSRRSCLRATALHPGREKGNTKSEGGHKAKTLIFNYSGEYNKQWVHSGKHCYRKTPMPTCRNTLPVEGKEMLGATLWVNV